MMVGITLSGVKALTTNSPIQFNSPNQFGSSSNTRPFFPATGNGTKPAIQYQVVQIFRTNILTFTNNYSVTNVINVTNLTQITTYVTITNVINVTNTAASTSTYIVAASGSCSDVQNAVAAAQTQGITNVWIPPGSNVWNCGVLIDPGINLLASNTVSILFNTNYSQNGIYLNAGGSSVTVISNFVFDVGMNGITGGILAIDGSNVCFRVTHCKFLHAGTGAQCQTCSSAIGGFQVIQVGSENTAQTDGPFGLFDNCTFNLPGGPAYNCINVKANGSKGGSGYCWRQTNTWGQVKNVVIEKCVFNLSLADFVTPGAAVEDDDGARIIFRYNTVTNICVSVHGQNNGNDNVGGNFGNLEIEMYNNTFVYTNGITGSNATYAYMFLCRGGSALVYSNTYLNQMPTGQFGIGTWDEYWVECASSKWADEFCGHQLTTNDYPAYQQVGQGLITVNGTGYQPVYIWSNSWPSATFPVHNLGKDVDSAFIKQGRDIYTNQPMPNYVPLIYPHPLNN